MAPAPPVPPRPFEYQHDQHGDEPPPVPPLPPNFHPDQDVDYNDEYYAYASSGPHFADPLVAPRPQRLTPQLPADVRLPSLFFFFSVIYWIVCD